MNYIKEIFALSDEDTLLFNINKGEDINNLFYKNGISKGLFTQKEDWVPTTIKIKKVVQEQTEPDVDWIVGSEELTEVEQEVDF